MNDFGMNHGNSFKTTIIKTAVKPALSATSPPGCARMARRCQLTGAFLRRASSPPLSPFSRCHPPPPSPGAPPQAVKQKKRAGLARALGLLRSRARALAVHRLDTATKLVLSPSDTPTKQRFSCSRSHIYPISRCPPPFPLLPRVEPPQTTTRRDDTSLVAGARELSSPTLFRVQRQSRCFQHTAQH